MIKREIQNINLKEVSDKENIHVQGVWNRIREGFKFFYYYIQDI
jgi:hypothetical protein